MEQPSRYVCLLTRRRPGFAEIADRLTLRMKDKLRKSLAAVLILDRLGCAAPFYNLRQFTLKGNRFCLPRLGIFSTQVDDILANGRPTKRRDRTFAPSRDKRKTAEIAEILGQFGNDGFKIGSFKEA